MMYLRPQNQIELTDQVCVIHIHTVHPYCTPSWGETGNRFDNYSPVNLVKLSILQ